MVTVMGTVRWLRYTVAWTPLQWQYLHAYLWTGLPLLRGDDVDVLVVVDGTQSRWALDDDVTPVLTKEKNDLIRLIECGRSHRHRAP
jgi:hypothetical protein